MIKRKIKKELSNFIYFCEKRDFLSSGKPTNIWVRTTFSNGTFESRTDVILSEQSIDYVRKKGPICLSYVDDSYIFKHIERKEHIEDFSVTKLGYNIKQLIKF